MVIATKVEIKIARAQQRARQRVNRRLHEMRSEAYSRDLAHRQEAARDAERRAEEWREWIEYNAYRVAGAALFGAAVICLERVLIR